MKKYLIISLLLFVAGAFRFAHSPSKEVTGNVEFIIIPKVGEDFFFMDSTYTNKSGEQFTVRKLKFFISDIGLATSSSLEQHPIGRGIFFLDSDSLDNRRGEVKNTLGFQFPLKEGDYTDVRFNIGVPREANHGDPGKAAYPLDLGNKEMFWEWNSGYIFFLMEGNTIENADNFFHFALGGDSRNMAFAFGNLFDMKPLVQVKKNKTTKVYFSLDLKELFHNGDGTDYSLRSIYKAQVHGGYHADQLSLNMKHALSLDSVVVK